MYLCSSHSLNAHLSGLAGPLWLCRMFCTHLACLVSGHYHNAHYWCRVRECVHPLITAVLRNSTCWWRGRSVEKPPDHSVNLGQTTVCDLSKHDKELGKWCEKQRGWRRERQTVVRKPWGEWCGFTAGHSDCVRTENLRLFSHWKWSCER